jgi:hypothetical protein
MMCFHLIELSFHENHQLYVLLFLLLLLGSKSLELLVLKVVGFNQIEDARDYRKENDDDVSQEGHTDDENKAVSVPDLDIYIMLRNEVRDDDCVITNDHEDDFIDSFLIGFSLSTKWS